MNYHHRSKKKAKRKPRGRFVSLSIFLGVLFVNFIYVHGSNLKPSLQFSFKNEVKLGPGPFKLGDLAECSGQQVICDSLLQISVGQTAQFGLNRYFSLWPVYERHIKPFESLYTLEVNWDSRVRIITLTSEWSLDSLDHLIESWLSKKTKGKTGVWEWDWEKKPKSIPLPKGSFSLNISQTVEKEVRGRQSLVLEIQSSQPELQNQKRKIPFTILVRQLDSVWIAKERITRGSHLSANLFKREFRDISKIPTTTIEHIHQIEGKLAKRTLLENRPLTTEHVELPAIVMAGSDVKVVANKENIVVTIDAVAREEGRLGEIIQVRDYSGKRIINAKVLDEKTLEWVGLVTGRKYE